MIIAVTGTGTGVGKTRVSAGLCALASAEGRSVTYLKLAQTGVPGELPDVEAVGAHAPGVRLVEGARFREPMSPEAAARAEDAPPLLLADALDRLQRLASADELVVVEGAGGLLVRFGPGGWGLPEVCAAVGAALVVVTSAELGTLNTTALTLEACRARSLAVRAVVVNRWPAAPGMLARSNAADLETIAGMPPVLLAEGWADDGPLRGVLGGLGR